MTRPVFIASDLHVGISDARDNFFHLSGGRREDEFHSFLDYVESKDGYLVVNGDLLECWQNNLGAVLAHRRPLLDRLADMGARYLIGNHDSEVLYLREHPLFLAIGKSLTLRIAHQDVLILHGHEQDPYCCGDRPGIGRISAIYTGLKEDRNGSPLQGKYGSATVEARTLGRLGWVTRAIRKLKGEPSPTQIIRRNMVNLLDDGRYDAVIFGHTHEPGQFWDARMLQSPRTISHPSQPKNHCTPLPIYNCGSWTEQVCSFVRIEPDGHIGVFDWVNGQPVPNVTSLLVEG